MYLPRRHGNGPGESLGSIKELTILINHLEKYPLCTQKAADFILFNRVIALINSKSHLTNESLNQIVSIKTPINFGLSDLLRSEFINYNYLLLRLKTYLILIECQVL